MLSFVSGQLEQFCPCSEDKNCTMIHRDSSENKFTLVAFCGTIISAQYCGIEASFLLLMRVLRLIIRLIVGGKNGGERVLCTFARLYGYVPK